MVFFIAIFLVLFIIYAVLIDGYRRAWNKIPVTTILPDTSDTFITVIIPARNEAHNIPKLLSSLQQQTYNKSLFEIIVVDDHSEDGTYQLVKDFASDISIKPIKLADFITTDTNAHKKKAIEVAISQATGSLIVTTDADCTFHPQWLSTIASFYIQHGAKFIAAPVKIDARRSVLSVFQTLDFITLQGITGASVSKRFHTMCNGANLSYEKEAFYEVNGFNGIDNIPSGDDMLLMHKIFRKYPDRVQYLKSEEAIVTTEPALSWKAFFHQRIRWASKATHYDDKRIFYVLLLVYMLNVCFLVITVAVFFNTTFIFLLLLFFIAKLLIEFPFVNSVAAFFKQQSLMKYFLVLQPLHILYTIIAGWLGKFGSFEWKGRKIKTK